jgi:hypothetical protein
MQNLSKPPFLKFFKKKKEKKKVISPVEVFKKSSFLEKILPEPINVVDCTFEVEGGDFF